jgi:cytochrome c peroxidase
VLSPAELRGLRLFNRFDQGNCIACHPSGRGPDHEPPLFTDFTYDNLGVPRNTEIPGTADPAYFDLGLCGPDRTDLAERKELCGAFKVPTLRNVATRKVFFHNGRFNTLREALRFYVQRDTNPDKFYPKDASGAVRKFDDTPPELAGNVNTTEVPYDRGPGEAPRLTQAELDDLEAFLGTLTDHYTPTAPARARAH